MVSAVLFVLAIDLKILVLYCFIVGCTWEFGFCFVGLVATWV